MNTILLRKIQNQILSEPRQFNMKNWFSGQLPDGSLPANCGTAACIGGWAQTFAMAVNPDEAQARAIWTDEHAAMVLGLTERQARLLFIEDNWPKQFQSTDRAGVALRAKRAAKRIDHFIKTKGRE
jgi:hypothetical protein